MSQEEMLVAERLLSALASIEETLAEIKSELNSMKVSGGSGVRQEDTKILNITQAAELLGVTRQTVNRMVRSGQLKKKVVGGRIGLLKSDLLTSRPLN